MSGRKPRRVRFAPVTNTMAIALHNAAKPNRSDVGELLDAIKGSFKALREGVATERQWSILAGTLDVALAVERQGVVRGLHGHLMAAEQALQTIYNRAMLSTGWQPTALHYRELDAIHTFVDLHAYQVKQLSRAEYLAAIRTAQARNRNLHNTVTVVTDLERLAA
jgi:hypothetical protein